MKVLGLDVSTTCLGVCVIDSTGILKLDHISFNAKHTLWDKADVFAAYIGDPFFSDVSHLNIEESLMGFRPGMSSAQTITTLAKFNGLVSYIARNALKLEPEYVAANTARKLCGVVLKKPSLCGMSHKEQTFQHMLQNDLKNWPWPLKRKSTDHVTWARDETDAYVVARSRWVSLMP